MKSMRLKENGSRHPFEMFEKPDTDPGPFQVAIRVHAASLNPADAKSQERQEAAGKRSDGIMGFDAAGTVVAVGPRSNKFAIGEEVYGCVGGLEGLDGAFSQRMLADERLLAKKPDSLTFREAAALPLAVITAWEGLVDRADVKPGERVLVHGGTGGVGHLAIQIAKAMGGIVHTTISSVGKGEIAKKLGADETINYRDLTVEEYVEQYTKGQGYDVIFDTVGQKNLEKSVSALATNGRISATVPGGNIDLWGMSLKNATLHVILMLIPLITGNDRERHGTILSKVSKLVDNGQIVPLIDDKQFNLNDLDAAFDRLSSGEAIGKVVVDID